MPFTLYSKYLDDCFALRGSATALEIRDDYLSDILTINIETYHPSLYENDDAWDHLFLMAVDPEDAA